MFVQNWKKLAPEKKTTKRKNNYLTCDKRLPQNYQKIEVWIINQTNFDITDIENTDEHSEPTQKTVTYLC